MAFGHATAHWQYFGLRHQPEIDTLLRGTIKRVKLDDGSYLNVLDDSDLADFINHHAWFEGDEVALPREDRAYLLGNLTGQTPKKRRVTQSRSDLKVWNSTFLFRQRQSSMSLIPTAMELPR